MNTNPSRFLKKIGGVYKNILGVFAEKSESGYSLQSFLSHRAQSIFCKDASIDKLQKEKGSVMKYTYKV